MQAETRPIQMPLPNVETKPYWTAADQGQLMIKRCKSCGEAHHYPRAYCPQCWGETDWIQASGRGAVYSFSVMRRAAVPFAIAYVALEEGPIMVSNIVECDLDALYIGQPVEVCFQATQEGPRIPMFRPTAQ